MNFAYILKCKDESFYTGWTNDIVKRLDAHRSGKGAKYTRGRGPLELVYLEAFDTRTEAMRREAYIKRLTKLEKSAFIQKSNWKDHLEEWQIRNLPITMG